jgi:hypothetical protein
MTKRLRRQGNFELKNKQFRSETPVRKCKQRPAHIAANLIMMCLPSTILANTSDSVFAFDPEAPFSVQCRKDTSGVGGYLVQVQNTGKLPMQVYDLVINDRLECSVVRVVRGPTILPNGKVEVRYDWNDRRLMHAIWLRNGKAIIDAKATYSLVLNPIIVEGKPRQWQTACPPADVKVMSSLGYAEFKFERILDANPGTFLDRSATPSAKTRDDHR